MTGLAKSDRRYCEQVALIAGSPLGIAIRFEPRESYEAALSLEALFHSVGEIPCQVSEPAVGLAKLSWWQKELQPGSLEQTQHPIVRALRDTGVLDRPDREAFNRYFHGLAAQVIGGANDDESALLEIARSIGGNEALIRSACRVESGRSDAVVMLGAGAYLYRKIGNLRRRDCTGSWWVPLDLQARFGLTFDSLATGAERLEQLIAELARLASAWLRDGRRKLGDAVPREFHLQAVLGELQSRQLLRLARRPQALMELSMPSSGITDAVTAWSLARRLRKSSSK